MVSLAGWLVGPERLVAIVAAAIGGIGAVVAGLPVVVVGLIALAFLALTLVIVRTSLALRDRFRQQLSPGATEKSHGILVKDSKGVDVEGNDVAGYDIGIGEYSSTDGPIRDNRIDSEVSGDQNINYGEQHVGINKGTINIVSAQPSVKAEPIVTNKKIDDGYLSEVRVRIKDGYAAQKVAARFTGQTILRGDFVSASGITFHTAQEVDSNQALFNAGPPLSSNEYTAQVVTEKPDNLLVEVAVLQ